MIRRPVLLPHARRVVVLVAPLLGLALVATTVAVGTEPHQAGGLAATAVQSGREASTRPSRPNIVVVMADDMRADDLVFTPAVRALFSRRGVTFANSFSNFPLCCPARASFLTGRFAHNHRVLWHDARYGYGAFDDSRTLATSLRAAGYATGYVGKYLNRYGPARSLVSGQPSYSYVPRGWTDWRAAIDANPHVRGGTYNYMSTPFNVNGEIDQSHRGEYQTDVVGEMSREMAAGMAGQDRPFFMYVNFLAPHEGGPPEADDTRYVRDAHGNRHRYRTPARPGWVRGMFDDLVGRGSGVPRGGGPTEANVADQPYPFSGLPELNRKERRALRDVTRQRGESMFVMDRQIESLVRTLKRSGAWADTVLVFTSDNGYYLGEHRHRMGKIRAHEPSFRVPFLVTGPGMRSGEVRYDPISTVDASATILDLAGAEPPARPDGGSRVKTMRSGDQGWSHAVLYEAIHTSPPGRAGGFDGGARTAIGVRTARYSYIRNFTGVNQLYDLRADPLQNRNVFADPSYAPARKALAKVWKRLKNCKGRNCRVALPPSLAAAPKEAARLGRRYWRVVERTYGFGR